jgi:hypothetical protein
MKGNTTKTNGYISNMRTRNRNRRKQSSVACKYPLAQLRCTRCSHLSTSKFQQLSQFNTIPYSMTFPCLVNGHPSCSIVHPNTSPSPADPWFQSYSCLTNASKDVCIPGVLWMDETATMSLFESVTSCQKTHYEQTAVWEECRAVYSKIILHSSRVGTFRSDCSATLNCPR